MNDKYVFWMDVFRAFIANLPYILNFLVSQTRDKGKRGCNTIEITLPPMSRKNSILGQKSTTENGAARYTESIDLFERRWAHCREHAFYTYLLCKRLRAVYRFTWTLSTRLTWLEEWQSNLGMLWNSSHRIFFPSKREHRRSNIRRKRV